MDLIHALQLQGLDLTHILLFFDPFLFLILQLRLRLVLFLQRLPLFRFFFLLFHLVADELLLLEVLEDGLGLHENPLRLRHYYRGFLGEREELVQEVVLEVGRLLAQLLDLLLDLSLLPDELLQLLLLFLDFRLRLLLLLHLENEHEAVDYLLTHLLFLVIDFVSLVEVEGLLFLDALLHLTHNGPQHNAYPEVAPHHHKHNDESRRKGLGCLVSIANGRHGDHHVPGDVHPLVQSLVCESRERTFRDDEERSEHEERDEEGNYGEVD